MSGAQGAAVEMKLPFRVADRFAVPILTPARIALAFGVAVVTDLVQLLSGPLGWVALDEVLDVIAMVLTCGALGFHPLLLPTFILELLPVTDLMPTWTGCTAMVVILRRRAQQQQPQPPPVPHAPKPAQSNSPVIDIEAERVEETSRPPSNRPR